MMYQQNLKLKDTVLNIVSKMELFIDKTIEMRDRKSAINQGLVKQENEGYMSKKQEYDSYMR